MMLADIAKYVSLAFTQAGDLVKTLTITNIVNGDFNELTGKYAQTVTTFTVDALDDEDDEIVTKESTHNRLVRKYLIKSSSELEVGQTFTDDSIQYTINRLQRIQQNSVIFVYTVWAIS